MYDLVIDITCPERWASSNPLYPKGSESHLHAFLEGDDGGAHDVRHGDQVQAVLADLTGRNRMKCGVWLGYLEHQSLNGLLL